MSMTGSITTNSRPTAMTMQQKPTSAIVNIAYAMQYQLAPEPAMKKGTKIGIGAGVAGAGLLILILLAFFIRRCLARKKAVKGGMIGTSPSQRFGSQIDMSRVAHEPAGVARTHDGAKYTGVSTRPMGY